MHYLVRITSCSKQVRASNDSFRIFDRKEYSFPALDQVKCWLTNTYTFESRKKRKKMYRGNNQHIGYVYRFREKDYSHAPIEEWIQEDWVTVSKVEETYETKV